MQTDPQRPADTRVMGVVHDALRRDLARLRASLLAEPPVGRRRVALAEHAGWLMRFLHDHHSAEDEALWPLVLQRRPSAAPLLDRMAAQHDRIGPAVSAVREAAEAYRVKEDDDARRGLLAAVCDLEAVLLPHLREEEDEAMPVVSAALTHQEWTDLEQQRNVAGKSLLQLADEGHFLLDGLDAERRRLITHLVPPVPRLLLLHGLARRYRRRVRLRWGRPEVLRRCDEVSVDVGAPPAAVWDVVSDITRVGEWSHECSGGRWLGGAGCAAPGAQFRGRNRQGLVAWSRRCELVAVDAPHELVWRTVPTLLFPDSTTWRIRLQPLDGGTRVTQRYEVTRLPPELLERTYARVLPAHLDRRAALIDDLRRLGAVAGGSRVASTSRPQRA